MYLKRPDGFSTAGVAGAGGVLVAKNARLPAVDGSARLVPRAERRSARSFGLSVAAHLALGSALLLLVRPGPTVEPAPELAVPFVWEAPPAPEPPAAEPARATQTEPAAPAEAAPAAPATNHEAEPPPPAAAAPEATPEIPSVLPEPAPVPMPSAPQPPAAPPEPRAPPRAHPPVPVRAAPQPQQSSARGRPAPARDAARPPAEPRSAIDATPPRTAPVVVAAHPVAGMNTNRPPAYPPLAQRRGEEGVVIIRVDVTTDGQPRAVAVLRSSGHALLDEAAAAAVRQWRFVPATRDNVPIAASADVPVEFRLPR